jgi:general secretion pathway protein C
VEALLRKYLWAIDLAVIALCSVFLARAAASAVESSLVIPPARSAARLPLSQPATVYSKEVEPILKRNMFCSGCPPIIATAVAATESTPDPTPQKSSLPLTLMAIMFSPPPTGLKWSVAVVRDTEDKSMGAFGVGGKVHNATITEIEETRIYLDNQGKTEYLDLLDVPPPAAAPVATAAPSPSAASDPLAAEMDKGIKKLSENNYEIQRSTLESVLGNMNLLSRSARIVPEIKDGKAAGFRLYSVRPDGPFAKIGMQNGDVIASINGLEITSPEKALEVYAKLKSASHLSLGLERNGQKVTKDYSIR